MKITLKTLTTTLIATSLLAGCASTDPYTPESDKDFVYDNDMSFAMNVVDGSLGFHNGLRDAARPKDAETTPGTMDYMADGIIGFGAGGIGAGGIGGAFLSMLGTNQGNKPLHSYYGIVYYPIKDRNLETIKLAFTKIEDELIQTAIEKRELQFVGSSFNKNGTRLHTFSGLDCDKALENWNFPPSETCNYISHKPAQLLKYASATPNGQKGLYAVIGYEELILDGYLSLDLDQKFYYFSHKTTSGKRTKFPFISNDRKIHLFIKPSKENIDAYLNIDALLQVDPWVKKHYQGVD